VELAKSELKLALDHFSSPKRHQNKTPRPVPPLECSQRCLFCRVRCQSIRYQNGSHFWNAHDDGLVHRVHCRSEQDTKTSYASGMGMAHDGAC